MTTEKKRILVVEDSKVAQKFALIILTSLGCEVDTADTGMQAIELTGRRMYDMVLMDLGLPDMDGLTVTETIRKMEHRYQHRMIIAALSAHSADSGGMANKQLCLDAGMDDYFEKPLTKELAMKMLEKFLGCKEIA